jgi:hypothetical protein
VTPTLTPTPSITPSHTPTPTPTPIKNIWIGPIHGDWNGSPGFWSKNSIPDPTDEVVIPGISNLTVLSGTTAVCKKIDVQYGAVFDVQAGAILSVKFP